MLFLHVPRDVLVALCVLRAVTNSKLVELQDFYLRRIIFAIRMNPNLKTLCLEIFVGGDNLPILKGSP